MSIPDRNWSVPAFAGGLGVVGREGIGVTDRDTTPFSLESLDSGRWMLEIDERLWRRTPTFAAEFPGHYCWGVVENRRVAASDHCGGFYRCPTAAEAAEVMVVK